MIMTNSIIVATAFVAGIGSAMLFKPTQSDQTDLTAAERPLERPRERKVSDRTVTRNQSLDDQLAKLRSMDERAKFEEMDTGEIQALLEALESKKEEFYGLDNIDQGILGSLISAWALNDRDGAIAWIVSLESERDRQRMLRDVVVAVGKVNLEEGLALMDDFQQTYGIRVAQPWSLLESAASRDANAMVRLLRASATKDGRITMYPALTYPQGFDFETALNGLEDIQASLPEGEKFLSVPGNILEEWSKRDPQSALDWVLLGKDVDSNSGVREFMEGYKKNASDAELVGVVSDIYEKRDGYTDTLDALSGIGRESLIRQFFDETDADGGENQLVEGLLSESISATSGENGTVRRVLLDRMDAQQRIEFFTDENAPKPANPKLAEQLRAQLGGLGHSPEEIDRMTLPARAESE